MEAIPLIVDKKKTKTKKELPWADEVEVKSHVPTIDESVEQITKNETDEYDTIQTDEKDEHTPTEKEEEGFTVLGDVSRNKVKKVSFLKICV